MSESGLVRDVVGEYLAVRMTRALTPAEQAEYEAAREAEDAAYYAAKRAEAWESDCEVWRVPRTLRWARLESPTPTPALTTVREWITAGGLRDGRCLVLGGMTGVGKSFAAVAACRASHARGWAFRFFPAMCADLLSADRQDDAMRLLRTEALLVLDDFGAEYVREGGVLATRIDELVWHREGNRCPTILTTNLTPERLRDRLSDRIVDRLTSWADVHQIVGPSLRRAPLPAAD